MDFMTPFHYTSEHSGYLKLDSNDPTKKLFYFKENRFKIMKNTFHSILKALFVPRLFKILSFLFGHLEKAARLGSKIMTSQDG